MLKTDSPSPTVRLITLDRPDRLNAMTAELCETLHAELDRIAADRSCRAVVLTGAGRAFCVGLDLAGYGEAPGNDGTDNARDRLGNQEHMSRLILKLRATPQPVIAAVNGPAAGFGLALALGSDIRYAAPEAVFRAVFLNVGVSNCTWGRAGCCRGSSVPRARTSSCSPGGVWAPRRPSGSGSSPRWSTARRCSTARSR